MRRTTRTAVVLALGWLAGGAADASAAWDNVFQTTGCCGESSRSSYFAPAPPPLSSRRITSSGLSPTFSGRWVSAAIHSACPAFPCRSIVFPSGMVNFAS